MPNELAYFLKSRRLILDKPHSSWPAKLAYEIQPDGVRFTASAELMEKGRIQLPSAAGILPKEISAQDQLGVSVPYVIQNNKDEVFVELSKGKFLIRGLLPISNVPSELPVPPDFALVTIRGMDNPENISLERSQSTVRIKQKKTGQAHDSLSVSIFRRIKDDSPLFITTLLRLNVSGRARSVPLGRILPEQAVPIAVNSVLAFHLSTHGDLSLQLLPGQYDITVDAVIPQPVSSIKLSAAPSSLLPQEELWSWVSNPLFRSVKLSGATSVGAQVTQVPQEWMAVRCGQSLAEGCC